MIPLLIVGAGLLLIAASPSDKKKKKGLGAVKKLNTGWNDRRPVRSIDINSLKPQASIDAINKIISGKVIDYDLDVAKTGSMYLRFEVPQREHNFSIRVSDHSKIDGVDDDTIYEFDNDIEINIFSKERKEEALKFLKEYFSKISFLDLDKNVFLNKVEKKVLKMKYPELVEKYLKEIGVDTTKTKKQVQEQALQKFLELKPTGKLTKKEYEKSRGLFRLKSTDVYEGVITNASSTGGMVTIKNQTGKDFTIDNHIHNALLSFAGTGNYNFLEYNLLR